MLIDETCDALQGFVIYVERHALSRAGINLVGHDSHGVALVVEGQADDGFLLSLAVEPARGELEEEAVARLYGCVHRDAEHRCGHGRYG